MLILFEKEDQVLSCTCCSYRTIGERDSGKEGGEGYVGKKMGGGELKRERH